MSIFKIPIFIFLIILLPGVIYAQSEEALEWKECVKEAKINHPDLLAAADQVKQARASKEITRSPLLPQITSNASETTNRSANSGNSSGGNSTGSSGRQRTTTYQYGVTGQQLLFDGFKTSYDLSTAEQNIRSSQYNYDVTSSNVRLKLRTAFVDVLDAQEFLKVTEDIEARRKQTLELVRLRYEGGREHRGSLMKSEADLAEATYEVNQAKRNIYLSQRRITKEMGRSYFTPMVAIGDFEVKDKDSERPDFDKLAYTNPLLRQLVAQAEAAKYGLKSAYAQFFPQVFANANTGKTNTAWPPDNTQWSLGTSLTFPLFEGGSRVANVSKAKATLGQAQEDERSGRDGVIVTLSDTWTLLQDAIDNVEVQRKSLAASQERAKIAEAEYAIGLVSYDNWIIIEDNLVSAKKSFLNAETAALIAEATWIQAKGGTLEYDQE